MLGKTFSGHFSGSDRIGLRVRRKGISLILEQLKAARAEKWRQTGNALLTLDEAQTWIEETGLVLYLPRRAQLPVEAPSFVEAVLGKQDPTPQRAALQEANSLLNRLASDEVLIPLNLMGGAGEQPDFLSSVQVLPYIFALRGDRDWKHAPQIGGVRPVSPLIAHVYKALEKDGRATIFELRDRLGGELTEVAILRALTELWSELRVIPIFNSDGEPTLWELLKQRFSKALALGTSTSQLTAISVLTSLWLQTAIAATQEETEIFLSPLTSRNKIREVLRGLSATRQVGTLSAAFNTYHFVAGTLPEFPEVPEAPAESALEDHAPAFPRERPAGGGFTGSRDRRSALGNDSEATSRGPGDSRTKRPEREPSRESREGLRRPGFERRPAASTGQRAPGGFRERERGERGGERNQDRPRPSFDRAAGRDFPKRGEQPSTFRRREENQASERPRFRKSSESGDQPRRFAPRTDREERPSRPWQKREARPDSGRQQGGYTRRSGPPSAGRGEGRSVRQGEGRDRRKFEEGGFRPPRPRQGGQQSGRQQGGREEATRERRPRWDGPRREGPRTGQRQERPFDRPRSERSSQAGGFEKRSEGRGPRGFVRGEDKGRESREQRGSARPPRREPRWKTAEEGSREGENRPRREAAPGARPSGRFRSERPSPGKSSRPGGFGAKGGKPKSSGGGFGKRSSGGKFSSKPGNRPAKKFGRKERPE